VKIILIFSVDLPMIAFRGLDVADIAIAIWTKGLRILVEGLHYAIVSWMSKVRQRVLSGFPYNFDFFVAVVIGA